ncbi:MAG: amidohydrolase [Chitinophagaceae bacterium]|nr:MAG: amidohydrolase [Chitinophagaceae bacterium]
MLTITIIQTDLHWENKAANMRMLEDKLRNLKQPTEIVLFPEMFTTGFSMSPSELAETMDGESVQWMRDMAVRHRVVLGGSVIIKEAGNFYNRFIWMLPNGQMGTYDKRHRFAFAGEDKHYSAGSKRTIAQVKGWKINLQVCYDLRFPVWSRQQLKPNEQEELTPEFDVLIYVANWPERRSHAWKTLLCARAIENQCYVVGVNRVGKDGNDIYHSGNSMVIDALGEVLYHMADDEDIFTISLQREHLESVRARFPFWKDGDPFSIEA